MRGTGTENLVLRGLHSWKPIGFGHFVDLLRSILQLFLDFSLIFFKYFSIFLPPRKFRGGGISPSLTILVGTRPRFPIMWLVRKKHIAELGFERRLRLKEVECRDRTLSTASPRLGLQIDCLCGHALKHCGATHNGGGSPQILRGRGRNIWG